MSKDPAVLFYTQDFLTGCTDLTFEERGQYITLLCLQHQKGHLSEKTIRLTLGSVSVDVMSKFLKDEQGCYYNERMEDEINKRQHFLDTRFFNGKKGGRPSKPNKKPNSEPTENLSDNDNENGNDIIIKGGEGEKEINIPFDYFWSMYDKKIDRAKCEKKWQRLTDDEREECMYYLPAYVKATPDIKFRRNPETYLNNKSWQNEIIGNGKHKGTGATDAELIELFATKYGVKP
ncbi:MAG TPA: hypothetical protein PKL04_11260 [Methanofastidiosum sp.]|nr:hypothetical protein [Methanofastidiosum sp.]